MENGYKSTLNMLSFGPSSQLKKIRLKTMKNTSQRRVSLKNTSAKKLEQATNKLSFLRDL